MVPMSALAQLLFCLEKADQCDDAASTAEAEHAQAIYRALAAHWREIASEIELSEGKESESGQFGPSVVPESENGPTPV
jgi:hypothetical protein